MSQSSGWEWEESEYESQYSNNRVITNNIGEMVFPEEIPSVNLGIFNGNLKAFQMLSFYEPDELRDEFELGELEELGEKEFKEALRILQSDVILESNKYRQVRQLIDRSRENKVSNEESVEELQQQPARIIRQTPMTNSTRSNSTGNKSN